MIKPIEPKSLTDIFK